MDNIGPRFNSLNNHYGAKNIVTDTSYVVTIVTDTSYVVQISIDNLKYIFLELCVESTVIFNQ